MSKQPMKDLVVLLPGITGSVLQRDGKDVWAFSPGAALRGLFSGFDSIRGLELVDDDWQEVDLGDGVTADRVLPDLHLIPGFWKIDGYGVIERFLTDTFELTRGENYIPFAYDWRRDNRASAMLLRRRSHDWLRAWRERSGDPDAKLVLVAHSMGGLVSRYFVEALEGWKDTRAVMTVGTPFYGSPNAVDFLTSGMRKGIGPVGVDLSALLRSLTSVHQLVPVYRCVFDASGAQVTPAEAGLPGWQAAWDTPLTEFHREVEDAARANRKDADWERSGTVYRPVVGTDQRTWQSARVVDGKVKMLHTLGDGDGDGLVSGDGTVPELSAALDGTQDAAMYSPQQHARMQNHTPVLDQLKGVLRSFDALKINDVRRAVTAWFSYDGGDIYTPDEPITFELAMGSELDRNQLPSVDARVRLLEHDTDTVVQQRTITATRDHASVAFAPAAPGVYTIEVRADGAAPVSDVVAVLSPSPTGEPRPSERAPAGIG